MRECKKGWIQQYLDYTKPHQGPPIFHTWTAISMIASIMGRHIWMDRGFYTLFPNLYTILVSQPGVGCKTTTLRIGDALLMQALPDLVIMRGALTVAFLADLLTQVSAKHPTKDAEVTIFCEEFKVFSKGLYADSGLIENLTKVYDCGVFEYNTRGKGTVKVDRPCVNLRAASTPEWLTTGSATDFIGGGFSSRLIPVAHLQDEVLISWPEKTQVERDMETILVKDLIEMSKLKGPIAVTKEAKRYSDEWNQVKKKYRNPDKRLDGFYSKLFDLMLKVSMSLAVSLDDDMVVQEEHIESSIKLLGKVAINIPFAYQGVVWGEQQKWADAVRMEIKKVTVIEHSSLLRAFRSSLSGEDLSKIIKTLTEEDSVCFDVTPTGGRPKITYRSKDDILKGNKCSIGKDCNNLACPHNPKRKKPGETP